LHHLKASREINIHQISTPNLQSFRQRAGVRFVPSGEKTLSTTFHSRKKGTVNVKGERGAEEEED